MLSRDCGRHLPVAMREPINVLFDDPAALLQWVSAPPPGSFDLHAVNIIEPWALVALATPARTEGPAPLTVHESIVSEKSASEDTIKAQEFARDHLLPRIVERRPVVLDFGRMKVCTQGFVHALLFEPLRVAWTLRSPIHVVNATPAVRSVLELLERYALGG